MKKLYICFFLVVFLLIGCGQNTPSNEEEKPEEKPTIEPIYKLGAYGDYVRFADENRNPEDLEKEYSKLSSLVQGEKNGVFESKYQTGLLQFFSIEEKIKLTIDIKEEELQKLNEDYAQGNKESYRICNLDIQMGELIFHYEQVGIRQKGNTSRGAILDEKGQIHLRHYKLSFTATFDDDFTKTPIEWKDEAALEYRDSRNFFGIEKLNIRWNRNQEKTYLREFYAFEMYRANGVLAPHTNPLQVEMSIDGDVQNLGIYLAVEDIDKTFLKRNIVKGATGGDLYKLGWTHVGATLDVLDDALFGVEKQIADGDKFKQIVFPYDLKTNKKTSNHTDIKTLIQNIIHTETSQFASFIESNMLYDYTIRYLAVSYLLGDPDDLRGNSNNTYLYFLEDTKQAIFIPTDHDRAVGSTGGSGNPTNHHGALNQPFDATTGYATNTTQFFTKTILDGGNHQIKKDYLKEIEKIIEASWLEVSTFQSYYDKVSTTYKDSIRLGSRVNGKSLPFSLTEELDVASGGNLSIEVYFNLKKLSFQSFHWNPSTDEEVSYSEYYLRGEMNGWNGIEQEYCLKIVDGILTLEIYLPENQAFKIADPNWNKEFNYTHLDSTDLFLSVGNENNIAVKKSGVYCIQILDESTLSIKKK